MAGISNTKSDSGYDSDMDKAESNPKRYGCLKKDKGVYLRLYVSFDVELDQ